MRAFFFLVLCAATAACSADQFATNDGGDDGGAGDAPSDQAAGPDGGVPLEGGGNVDGAPAEASCPPPDVACSGGCGTGRSCCVTSGNADCVDPTQGCSSGVSLGCRSAGDCTVLDGGGAGVCCLVGTASVKVGCPPTISVAAGDTASCMLAAECDGLANRRRLCSTASECKSGVCIHAAFESDSNASVGVCAN